MVDLGYYSTIGEAEFFTSLTLEERTEITEQVNEGYISEEVAEIFGIESGKIDSSYEYTLADDEDIELGMEVQGRKLFVIPPLVAKLRTANGVRQVLQTTSAGITRWVNIRNGSLAGTTKNVTNGVRFDANGFPVFSSRFTMILANNDLRLSTATHRARANAALRQQIINGNNLGFNAAQRTQILNKNTPSGFVWHHHHQRGRMQLVNAAQHTVNGHTGGNTIWVH